MGELFIGLVHYPVLNRDGDIVATSVTNLDIHDIARSARTYGVSRYFIINPMESQERLVSRIIEHWVLGSGLSYNPIRAEALKSVRVVDSIDSTIESIAELTGMSPEIVGTWAGHEGGGLSYDELRDMLNKDSKPYLILFGTGWGMTREIKELCTYIVEPIRGTGDYHHLSVRSAAAVILDRLKR